MVEISLGAIVEPAKVPLVRAGSESASIRDSDDNALLECAYRLHWREICRYIRVRFGSWLQEPEDVVQAAFVRYATLSHPAEIDNAEAFLKTTARNLALDCYRQSVRSRAALRDVELRDSDLQELTPENVVQSREELRLLGEAIERLAPKQRVALLMHRVDGLSYAEIGRRLGMSSSGARQLVEKAFSLCTIRIRSNPN